MPNHVDHDMVVSGPAEDLAAFADVARDGDKILSAEKFIPYPKKYADADAAYKAERERDPIGPSKVADGYNHGGYDWCIENWGTKWGIYGVEQAKKRDPDNDEEPLEYTFQSAWSSAIKIIAAMSKKFPALFFDVRYFERGMQFQGHFQYKAGKLVHQDESKYYGSRGG